MIISYGSNPASSAPLSTIIPFACNPGSEAIKPDAVHDSKSITKYVATIFIDGAAAVSYTHLTLPTNREV